MHWLSDYIKQIHAIANTGDDTEFSYRTPIDNMLKAAANDSQLNIDILQEPARTQNIGAPDFRVSAKGGIIGYVECKKPGTNLHKLLGKTQMQKYRNLSANLLLTDAHRWMLLRDGAVIHDITLVSKLTAKQKEHFSELLNIFMTAETEKVGNAKRLAKVLAQRCALLRSALKACANDEPAQSRLHSLLKDFRNALDSELRFEEFANIFAQTLVYSLLLAKLKAAEGARIDLYNINRHIPSNFALIRNVAIFFQELDDPKYDKLKWVLDDILAIINNLDTAAVGETMTYRKTNKAFSDKDDPYIYFYETFLATYDAKQRERCGVYYTPPPVVQFIIRAVDDLLRRDFNLPNGLAETNKVTALDFAAGTGTFMLEMMRTVLADTSLARRDLLTRNHILKNFYGFELLVAPYVIAHLKLSQYLEDSGVPLNSGERINIFLSNTLEKMSNQINLSMIPTLAEDVNRAQNVKDLPILVITGNPPYSGISQNKGEWITDLIETYKYVDGKHFGERKHWLQDDYVKFIRFAQHKMENVERGIVAIITNHSFLDNPTFRGMRQSLLNTFDALYFLDLHGNSKKKETAPDGGIDKNVFDIQQGVAISLLIKNPQAKKKGVFHADLYGKRSDKYNACLENTIETVQWETITPDSSPYFFVPHRNMPTKYKNMFSVNEIFSAKVSGIVTARDHFAIDTDKDALLQRIRQFINTDKNDSEIATKLHLKETRGWKIHQARKELAKIKNLSAFAQKIAYRPFDVRWVFYHDSAIDWGRERFMRHMLADKNLGLVTVRQVKAGKTWQHCFISQNIMESTLASNKTGEIAYLFPLYRYDEDVGKIVCNENLTPQFRQRINNHYGTVHTPEDIFGYIYAILHSPDYRQRYVDFLRTEYPRIPFPKENGEFKRLANIGNQLIQAHLLREHCAGDIAEHCGEGKTHKVENSRYDKKSERLYFNKEEWLAPIPPEVFDFQMGGYHPLGKYLKSRKGRILTLPEIETLQNAANAIAFTMKKMQEIDQ